VETIHIVLDTDLLRLADRAAEKLKTTRSALLRDALRAHLKRLDVQQKETRDRDGYLRYPDSLDEPAALEKVADWPDD
jgi:metal-responsive CopG/Arc/MetJ family transcriptional regulator